MTSIAIAVALVVFLFDRHELHEKLRKIEANQESLRGTFDRALQDNVDTVRMVRELLENNR